MTYEEWCKEIECLRTGAKKNLDLSNDDELGNLLDISASLLRNRSSEGRLPELRFWTVVQMAKAAGKKIVIE